MKVLQVTGDSVGGIRKHIHDIIFELSGSFDFFYVCSFKGDEKFKSEVNSIKNTGTVIKQLKIEKRPSSSDIINIIKIFKLIKKNNISVVHGHGTKGGLYARVAGKIAGIKVIYTPHGGVAHNMFSKIENILYKLVENTLAACTDLYIFESQYTKDSYINRHPASKKRKNIVNYNGIDVEKISSLRKTNPPPSEREIKIGFFGMLREEKGASIYLEQIKEIINKNKNISYNIFGNGPQYNLIKNEIEKYNLKKHMIMHGETENPYFFMNEMDIIFIPSLFESFGYVAVEAMVLKKTLVTSDSGALKEVCYSENDFIFESKNLKNCFDTLQNAINNFDNNKNTDKLNLAYDFAINRYSLKKMTKNLSYYYKTL